MIGRVARTAGTLRLDSQRAEDAVGCDKVCIDPKPVDGVDWAEGWLDTPKGRISVSWKRENGKPVVKSAVPSGVLLVVPES